jgi:putative transposase
MKEQESVHHRKSIRLKEYDYARPGAYFITICTFGRKSIFGDIVNGEMVLNQSGQIVIECWEEMHNHFPNIEIDYYILMPNHMHAIIFINSDSKGLMNQTPTHHLDG